MKLKTFEEFETEAHQIYNNKYDYSKVEYVNTRTPIIIICPEHGEFIKTPFKHLQGQGCPKCSSKKMDTSKFIERANIIHNNKYDYSKVEYVNNKTPITIICHKKDKFGREHGEFIKTPVNHLAGKQGCPKCSYEELSEKQTLSQEDAIKKFKSVHGDKYCYDETVYVHSHKKIKIYCKEKDEHGNEHGFFEQFPFNHDRGTGCPKCHKRDKIFNLDDLIAQSKLKWGDKFDFSSYEYNGIHTKSLLRCNEHGEEFFISPNNHLNSKHGGCPECLKDDKSIGVDEFIKRCNHIHGSQYDYSLIHDYYTGINRIKLPIICHKLDKFGVEHGTFWQSAIDHYNGNGCQKCSNKKSRLEDFIENYLIKNLIKYDKNTFDIINIDGKKQELDFYLPDYNIALEINGLRYHTEFIGGKHRNYHLNKTKSCENAGIRLIHINEDEIVHRPNIVISKLNSILNINKRKIYARKCIVKKIDGSLKSKFMSKYHMQGDDRSTIKLGLFYHNKLISVMTFQTPRNSKKVYDSNTYELSRYCGNFWFHVVGGASKMLKYFERNYIIKTLITHADKRWSAGELYYKLNFDMVRETSPTYRVTTGRYPYKTFHKTGFRHERLKDKIQDYNPNLSEWENLKNNGWDRIWDCGNMVFEKKYT